MTDFANETSPVEILPPGNRTASGTGPSVDLRDYIGRPVLLLHSAAGTGTAPTLDAKVQHSLDGVTFTDVVGYTFPQVAGATVLHALPLDTRAVRRYVRLATTIAGTSSPTFACSAVLIGRKQNQ